MNPSSCFNFLFPYVFAFYLTYLLPDLQAAVEGGDQTWL